MQYRTDDWVYLVGLRSGTVLGSKNMITGDIFRRDAPGTGSSPMEMKYTWHSGLKYSDQPKCPELAAGIRLCLPVDMKQCTSDRTTGFTWLAIALALFYG